MHYIYTLDTCQRIHYLHKCMHDQYIQLIVTQGPNTKTHIVCDNTNKTTTTIETISNNFKHNKTMQGICNKLKPKTPHTINQCKCSASIYTKTIYTICNNPNKNYTLNSKQHTR